MSELAGKPYFDQLSQQVAELSVNDILALLQTAEFLTQARDTALYTPDIVEDFMHIAMKQIRSLIEQGGYVDSLFFDTPSQHTRHSIAFSPKQVLYQVYNVDGEGKMLEESRTLQLMINDNAVFGFASAYAAGIAEGINGSLVLASLVEK